MKSKPLRRGKSLRHFSTETTQTANDYTEMYLTRLVIWICKLKSPKDKPSQLTGNPEIKKNDNHFLVLPILW